MARAIEEDRIPASNPILSLASQLQWVYQQAQASAEEWDRHPRPFRLEEVERLASQVDELTAQALPPIAQFLADVAQQLRDSS